MLGRTTKGTDSGLWQTPVADDAVNRVKGKINSRATTLWSVGFAAHTTRLPLLDLCITVLWVTTVSSAFNAIDNMDGVAAGITAIAAGGFLVIALQTQQSTLGGLSAALLGGSVGFLLFNVHSQPFARGDVNAAILGAHVDRRRGRG